MGREGCGNRRPPERVCAELIHQVSGGGGG